MAAWNILLFPQEAASTIDARGPEAYQDSLLRNEAAIEACRQAALRAIPGAALNFRVEGSAKGFHYRFDIFDRSRIMWAVLCDPKTLEIVDKSKMD